MKVLIWDMFELRNTGGPSGYLYNIHEYLKEHPNPNIVLLSDIINTSTNLNDTVSTSDCNSNVVLSAKRNPLKKTWHSLLYSLKCAPKLKSNITKAVDYIYRIYHIKWNGPEANLDLSEYNFIHFHFLIHIRQFRNTYPNFKGKTIVTSHSPCPWTYESIDRDPSIKHLKHFIIRQECKSYKSADYIMFPCLQAREPYEHNRQIKCTLEKMSNKIFYVPTSILYDNEGNIHNIQRKDINIPDNAFVIAFFGRHNNIKGYDILKEIAIKTLEKHHNLYFLLAGMGDIAPIEHPRWIELGFVSNVKDLMKVCDFYVVPNRETYFDLVVIEALRSGMIMSLSRTGGNKYFEQLPKNETKGLFFFDIEKQETVIEQIDQLIKTKEDSPTKFDELKSLNKALYLKYFTMERYVDNYIKELQCL